MITDNITVIGNDHIFKGIECQDSSVSWLGDGYSAAIVCDGHGGAKYIRSKIGSETACRVGREAIEEFMEGLRESRLSVGAKAFDLDTENAERQLIQLERAIILRWNEAVKHHLEHNPIAEDPRFDALPEDFRASLEKVGERAYGTTFIAAVMTDDFCFALKLGDGNVAVLAGGIVFAPAEFGYDPWAMNKTYSMCDSDADVMFSHGFYCRENERSVDGIVIMTDGVVGCYTSMEPYKKFIVNVFRGYVEDELETAHGELLETLENFTRMGSGDDISIGILLKKITANLPDAEELEN